VVTGAPLLLQGVEEITALAAPAPVPRVVLLVNRCSSKRVLFLVDLFLLGRRQRSALALRSAETCWLNAFC